MWNKFCLQNLYDHWTESRDFYLFYFIDSEHSSCFRVYFIPWSPLLHVKLVHNNSIKFIEEDYILATILDTSHVSANSISATTLWGKYYV